MTQTIGLNDDVKVKINKIGLQHLECEHYKRNNNSDYMWCRRDFVPPAFVPPPTDPDGYTVMSFTLFMNLFGNFNWCSVIPKPIDGDIIVIKRNSQSRLYSISRR